MKIYKFNDFVLESKREISGFKEVIEVEGMGKMHAKLDSGNTTPCCALIVSDYKEENGKVKFEVFDKKYEMDVVKHINIYHMGKGQERPVIKLNLKFNGKEYKDEEVDLKIVDLKKTKDNQKYSNRMLLCKDFIERANVLLDPSDDFKLTDRKDIKKQ